MRLALIVALLLILPSTLAAQATQPVNLLRDSNMVTVLFDEISKKAIRGYFSTEDVRDDNDDDIVDGSRDRRDDARRRSGKNKKKALPPGLAKRDSLPPGLQKQIERNGTLPPGLAKRELPADLERELPALPAGVERVSVANDVVLIEKATGRILDIIEDVMKPEATERAASANSRLQKSLADLFDKRPLPSE